MRLIVSLTDESFKNLFHLVIYILTLSGDPVHQYEHLCLLPEEEANVWLDGACGKLKMHHLKEQIAVTGVIFIFILLVYRGG